MKYMSRRPARMAAATAGLWLTLAAPALACGGLFCQQTPVDQTGEKILFAMLIPALSQFDVAMGRTNMVAVDASSGSKFFRLIR